jgi:hypothetical protein
MLPCTVARSVSEIEPTWRLVAVPWLMSTPPPTFSPSEYCTDSAPAGRNARGLLPVSVNTCSSPALAIAVQPAVKSWFQWVRMALV